jgi:hypothetical protein
MTVPDDFSRFLHSEGKSLAEINPGSEEQALKPEAALQGYCAFGCYGCCHFRR